MDEGVYVRDLGSNRTEDFVWTVEILRILQCNRVVLSLGRKLRACLVVCCSFYRKAKWRVARDCNSGSGLTSLFLSYRNVGLP